MTDGIGLGVTIHTPLSGVGKSDLSFFGDATLLGQAFTIRGGNTSGAWQIVAQLDGTIDLKFTLESLLGSTNGPLQLPRGFPNLTLSELSFAFDAETGDYDAHGRTAAANFSIAGQTIEEVSLALGIGSKSGSTQVRLESGVIFNGINAQLLVQIGSRSSALGLTAGSYEVFLARARTTNATNQLVSVRPGGNAYVTDVELAWAKRAWSSVPFRSQSTYPSGVSIKGLLRLADTGIGRLLRMTEPLRVTLNSRELGVEIGNGRSAKHVTIPLVRGAATSDDDEKASSTTSAFAEDGNETSADDDIDESTNAQMTITGPLSLAPIIEKFAPSSDGSSTGDTWRDYVGKCLQLENVGFSLITDPKIGLSIVLDASIQVGAWLGIAIRKAAIRLIPDKLPFTDVDVQASLQSAAMTLNLTPLAKASAAVRYERDNGTDAEVLTGSGQLQLFDKLNIGLLVHFEWQKRIFHGAFGFVFAKGFAVGPPAFQLTGIGGGFGYHRTLVLPKAAEAVATNSMVQLLHNEPDGDAFSDPSRMLDHLGTFMKGLERRPNAWCIAFGITFKIVEWVDCVALVIANVRPPGFDLALLGMADFPIGLSSYKLGHVQLSLLTRFNSEDQSLRILGALTAKSWLLHPNCKVRGGFAICMWVAGVNAGDFVVSIGGYSPLVPVKRHYPALDRLSFSWNVSDQLKLFGDMYCTLDRYGLQFGSRAGLKYTSRMLDVDTTFSFDVLSTWMPPFFQTKVRISVHFELRVIGTVRLSLVVDANVYGPPFGAEFFLAIDIKVWRHTFTIRAGATLDAAKKAAKPSRREVLAFAKGGNANATQLQVAGRSFGVSRKTASTEVVSFADTEEPETPQCFRADELVLSVATTIPVKTVYRQRESDEMRHPYEGDCIDVRPLGWQDVVSVMIWDIRGPTDTADWLCIPEMSRPLEALWYLPTNSDPEWKDSGRRAITSVRFVAPNGKRGDVGLGTIPTARLVEADVELAHTVRSMPGQTEVPQQSTSATVPIAEFSTKREKLLELLRAEGFDLDGCNATSPFRQLDAVPLHISRGARA